MLLEYPRDGLRMGVINRHRHKGTAFRVPLKSRGG
jgi:hypothetical protein